MREQDARSAVVKQPKRFQRVCRSGFRLGYGLNSTPQVDRNSADNDDYPDRRRCRQVAA